MLNLKPQTLIGGAIPVEAPVQEKPETTITPTIKTAGINLAPETIVAPKKVVKPVITTPKTTTTTTPVATKINKDLTKDIPPSLDAGVVLLQRAIRQHESGNRQVIPGEGEELGGASLYQYTHGTWKSVAQKYLGDANAPLTRENENKATYLRILDWRKQGYTPKQIASMWNAGEGRPNAYAENWRGVNDYGVKYDTPAYVDKVIGTFNKASQEYKKNKLKETEKFGDETASQFINNVLNQKRKEAGGVLDEKRETEIKRDIEINKNTLLGYIEKAAELGVDKNLATRLVERGMYDKLQELMESSGAAKKMGTESALNFKNVLNTVFSAEKMLGDLYGQTLAMHTKDVQEMQKSEQVLHDQSLKLIKTIRENRVKGKDTTRLEKQLSDITGVASTEFEDLFNVQNLSKLQVAGASAATVLDALGGSFTKTGAKKISTNIAGKVSKEFAPNILEGMVKQTAPKVLKQVGRTALVLGKEGAELGGLYGLSQGAMNDEDLVGIIKSGALGAGTGFLLGSATGAIGSGFSSRSYNKNVQKTLDEFNNVKTTGIEKLNPIQKLGAKISEVYVKPSQVDINNGYKTINIAKYDVGGPLDKALPKVQSKIKNYVDQLNEYIKLRGEEPTLTYGDVIKELETKYAEKGEQKLGTIGDKASELEKVKKELSLKYGDNWENEQIGFTDVMDDKRSAGLQAVFNHDPLRKGVGAVEQVWNDFYTNLKKRLEDNSPKEFQEINKAITDLIPIEQGYVRAARRMDKNNVLSLTDFIGATGAIAYNPATLAIPIIHRVFKSPRVANVLMKTGSIEKALGTVPTDELLQWGIKKYGNGIYDVDGIKVNTMKIKPEEVRKTIIDLKKNFNDAIKPKPGFIDLNAEVLPKEKIKTEVINKSKPTTKILNELNGKTTVKRQFIEDLMKRPDISKIEKQILEEALKTEGDVVNTANFAEKVQNELLPLKVNVVGGESDGVTSLPKYKNVALTDDLRGNVSKYTEKVYESPVKTSAGNVHFGGKTENYFGHTRVEDMAEKDLRRVIEVQSDLYQRGRLEQEKNRYVATPVEETDLEIMTEKFGNTKIQPKGTRKNEISKLEQYSDPTAHYRMVREEVKQAAIDGKEKLQFPTGETAMKIEGLGGDEKNWKIQEGNDIRNMEDLTTENLKIGTVINNGNTYNQWVITDIIDEISGTFKAVPRKDFMKEFDLENGISEADIEYAKEMMPDTLSDWEESFDISKKIDTSNPIYKFYQDTLGKYLKNRYGAKEITDAKGVKWYEVDINEKMKDEPVLAFGNTTIKNLLATGAVIGVGTLIAGIASENKGKATNVQETSKELPATKLEPKNLVMPKFSENKIPTMLGKPITDIKLPENTSKDIKSLKITDGKQTWEITDPEKVKVANRIKFITDKINPKYTNYLLKLANFEGIYNPEQRNENSNGSYDRGIFQINSEAFPQITDEMADDLDFSILWAISLIDAGKQKKWAADLKTRTSKITLE